jgi:hypothetical protein
VHGVDFEGAPRRYATCRRSGGRPPRPRGQHATSSAANPLADAQSATSSSVSVSNAAVSRPSFMRAHAHGRRSSSPVGRAARGRVRKQRRLVAVGEPRVLGLLGRAARHDGGVHRLVQRHERVRKTLRMAGSRRRARAAAARWVGRGGRSRSPPAARSSMREAEPSTSNAHASLRPADTCETVNTPRPPSSKRNRMPATSCVVIGRSTSGSPSPEADVSTGRPARGARRSSSSGRP